MAPRYVVFAGLAATVSVSNRMLRSGCLGAGVYVGTKVENVLEVANTGPALGTALSATLAGTGVAIARETSASMWASLIKCCEGILACTAMDRSLYICMLRGVAQLPCRVCSEIRGALTSKKIATWPPRLTFSAPLPVPPETSRPAQCPYITILTFPACL